MSEYEVYYVATRFPLINSWVSKKNCNFFSFEAVCTIYVKSKHTNKYKEKIRNFTANRVHSYKDSW